MEVNLEATMVEQWEQDTVPIVVRTQEEHRDNPTTKHETTEEGVIQRREKMTLL